MMWVLEGFVMFLGVLLILTALSFVGTGLGWVWRRIGGTNE
jgi:hypothetical protein